MNRKKPLRFLTSKRDTGLHDPGFLRSNFQRNLSDSQICFSWSVLIQDQKDMATSPVEDATIRWQGEDRRVADIRLQPQRIDTADRVEFCKNLRFSP